ncbi:DUF1311 domain-containing protein [Comamonas testosteroni]|uniref:DUF1311 domain-containing protein n=1 Tax=Comamonas testosteroni TaxID=285 RepID=A0A373FN32_COMTE|nr:lysozyme inhibitor LprI family protein [Comamonas testosteroni]RGE45327.1 DUF1311 domain-containing protein [Comamonas testosteroni]
MTIRPALWSLAAATAVLTSGAWAADHVRALDCKPSGNQQQLNDCAAQDYRAADAQLNLRYREVMATLSPELRDALRSDQRRWLRGRDPACHQAAKAYAGGSMRPMIFSSCLEKATRKRTAELQEWLDRQP